RVAADAAACVRWEGALDCATCGACCRHAYDSVTLSRREAAQLPELVVDRGDYIELRRTPENRCVALEGPAGGPWRCTVYDLRPRSCRDFEVGGRHCLSARRRVGLTF